MEIEEVRKLSDAELSQALFKELGAWDAFMWSDLPSADLMSKIENTVTKRTSLWSYGYWILKVNDFTGAQARGDFQFNSMMAAVIAVSPVRYRAEACLLALQA